MERGANRELNISNEAQFYDRLGAHTVPRCIVPGVLIARDSAGARARVFRDAPRGEKERRPSRSRAFSRDRQARSPPSSLGGFPEKVKGKKVCAPVVVVVVGRGKGKGKMRMLMQCTAAFTNGRYTGPIVSDIPRDNEREREKERQLEKGGWIGESGGWGVKGEENGEERRRRREAERGAARRAEEDRGGERERDGVSVGTRRGEEECGLQERESVVAKADRSADHPELALRLR